MSDEITPHAKPIATTGEPEWFPPPQDDSAVTRVELSPVRRVFYGADGLRAGWSLLLWIATAMLLGRALSGVLNHVYPPAVRKSHPPPEWFTLSNSAVGFLVVGIAGFVVSLVETRPFSRYGIGTLRGRAGDFGWGLLSGFGMLSILIGVLWKGRLIAFRGVLLPDAKQVLLWAFLLAVSFLFTGFFEEFTFRGFPQFTLTRGIAGILRASGIEQHAKAIAFWITAIMLAVLFGYVHKGNPGEGSSGLIAAGLIGLLFAFSLWRTGSLWWAIGWHAAWDWGESFFYGTADSGGVSRHRLLDAAPQGNPFYSGGTVGPEGSIWVFAIIALLALLIAATLKARPGSPAAEFEASRT